MDRWFFGGVFVFVSSCLLHSFGLVFDFGLGWDCWTRKVGSGWWHLLTLGSCGIRDWSCMVWILRYTLRFFWWSFLFAKDVFDMTEWMGFARCILEGILKRALGGRFDEKTWMQFGSWFVSVQVCI